MDERPCVDVKLTEDMCIDIFMQVMAGIKRNSFPRFPKNAMLVLLIQEKFHPPLHRPKVFSGILSPGPRRLVRTK